MSRELHTKGGLRRGSVPESNLWRRIAFVVSRGRRVECRLYRIWHSMRVRCKNPTSWNYKHYGARGVTVCEEWESYTAFREWALANGYRKGVSLDRIDNDGPYSPANCRWATRLEQAENCSRNRLVTYNDETAPVSVFARRFGLSSEQVHCRLNQGWSIERALLTAIDPKFQKRGKRKVTADKVRWARLNKHLPAKLLARELGVKSEPYAKKIAHGEVYRDVQ